MTSEVIAIAANLALSLSLIVAVVFGIVEVKAASRDRKERLTLDTLRNFQTREFAELIRFVNFRTLPANNQEFRALPSEDQTSIIEFGQQMESLGILVAEKLINIELIDKTLGSFITSAWEKYSKLFLDIREKQPDPFLGEYFQWLAESIDKRMKDNPRQPFYKVASREIS